MNHPAVDSLEHIKDLQHLRRMVPSVNQREALDAAITALTRPPGGSDRLSPEALKMATYLLDSAMQVRTGSGGIYVRLTVAEAEQAAAFIQALASPQGAEQRQECVRCGYDRTIRSAPGCGEQCESCGDDATPHPEQAASQGDAVERVAYALQHADGNAYSFEHYCELAKAALSSPTGVQAAQVSDAVAPAELIAALATVNRLNNLGDATYDVRARADCDGRPQGESSWDHPDVKAYSDAVQVIERYLPATAPQPENDDA